MKKIRILTEILKRTGVDKIVTGFILYLFISALFIQMFEPNITTYRESLWYSFVSFTTIGYGDVVAQTAVGRLLTVILTIYGVFVVALIPAVVVSYFTEQMKVRQNESMVLFMEQLKKLPELSPEELQQLSDKVKQKFPD